MQQHGVVLHTNAQKATCESHALQSPAHKAQVAAQPLRRAYVLLMDNSCVPPPPPPGWCPKQGRGAVVETGSCFTSIIALLICPRLVVQQGGYYGPVLYSIGFVVIVCSGDAASGLHG